MFASFYEVLIMCLCHTDLIIIILVMVMEIPIEEWSFLDRVHNYCSLKLQNVADLWPVWMNIFQRINDNVYGLKKVKS